MAIARRRARLRARLDAQPGDQLRELGCTHADAAACTSSSPATCSTRRRVLRAPSSLLARNRGRQAGLWAYGISGDLPIVLVRIADVRGPRPRCATCSRRTPTGGSKGVNVDLVVVERRPAELPPGPAGRDHMAVVSAAVLDASVLDRPAASSGRPRASRSPRKIKAAHADGRARRARDSRRHAAEQIEPESPFREAPIEAPDGCRARARCSATATSRRGRGRSPALKFDNGLGGFTNDGREYLIQVATRHAAPRAPGST